MLRCFSSHVPRALGEAAISTFINGEGEIFSARGLTTTCVRSKSPGDPDVSAVYVAFQDPDDYKLGTSIQKGDWGNPKYGGEGKGITGPATIGPWGFRWAQISPPQYLMSGPTGTVPLEKLTSIFADCSYEYKQLSTTVKQQKACHIRTTRDRELDCSVTKTVLPHGAYPEIAPLDTTSRCVCSGYTTYKISDASECPKVTVPTLTITPMPTWTP